MFRKSALALRIASFVAIVFLASIGCKALWAAGSSDPFGSDPSKNASKATATAKESHKSKLEIVEDIERALDEPTTMEFTDTPLTDVVDFLRDAHKGKHLGFEIVLDTKTLSDLGITPDTPMTKNLKGISLRSALRSLLRDLGLTYVIRNEVLLITSPDNACYTKVYDVADLVSSKDGQNQTALDSLMKMVVKTCPPSAPQDQSSWPGWVGTLSSADVNAVVVYQPEEVQDQIADLFAQLRSVKHTK